MKPRHRYQHPEPGDTGTGPAPSTPAPAAPLANHPQPATPTPAAATPAAPAANAPADKPVQPQDSEARIGAFLDTIGKDVGATPEPDPKLKPAEPVAGDTKPPVDPAKPGAPTEAKALDLTPPEGITDRAKTRWTELAERARAATDLERRASEAETALTGVRELVQESGLQPDEFQGMLAMGRLYKSADPADLRQAMEQLDGLRADLATRLGVDAPGIDMLAAHPDLKAEVEAMEISRERAIEIASLRNVKAQATAASAGQQDVAQYQATVQKAAQEMDATMAARAATPGHQAKVDHIRKYFADPARLNGFVTTYQPNQWKAAVLMMYDSYVPPAPPAPAAPAAHQPLRPGHVASGVRVPNGKPISSTEAVTNAWDAVGL